MGYWLFVVGLPCLLGWPALQRYLAHREEVRRQGILNTAEQFAQNYWQGEGDMDIYAAHVNNPLNYTLKLEGESKARVTLLVGQVGPSNVSTELITVDLSRDDLGQWSGEFIHKAPAAP